MISFFQKHLPKYERDHNYLLYKASNLNIRSKIRDPLPDDEKDDKKDVDKSDLKQLIGLALIKKKS